MPPLQLLIKPASSLCNLKCSYCFYADEAQNRRIPCYGVMQEDTLACVIRKALAQAEDVCTFGFQGGEPTLAGLPFFEKVVALERRYNTRNLSITHTIQTNGMVLDDAWATFLAREHFLVGLSLDGYAALHDLHRVDAQGNGTHARVLEAAALLARHHVETNILTVVTAQTARAPERLYRFFERQGLRYQQYIPCLPPLHTERALQADALTPEDYGRFLKILFDLWFEDVTHHRFIYIRYFENLVGMMRGYPPESCGMAGHCNMQHVVEADGSVYPCDFYVLDAYRLGNLCTDDFPQLYARLRETGFLEQSLQADAQCAACPWRMLCRGGCRRDRETASGTLARNAFCTSYAAFFEYATPRLAWLAQHA